MAKFTLIDLAGYLNQGIDIPDVDMSLVIGRNSRVSDIGFMDYIERPILEETQRDLQSVSRVHFIIGSKGYIMDLGSYNGTYVNGKRLGAYERSTLHHGDTIGTGCLRLQTVFRGDMATEPMDFREIDCLEDTHEFESKDLKPKDGENK